MRMHRLLVSTGRILTTAKAVVQLYEGENVTLRQTAMLTETIDGWHHAGKLEKTQPSPSRPE